MPQPKPTAELVSVVMSVYRPDEAFLPHAVASVLGQTHENLELVIVEDPSEGDARAMIDAAGLDDERIRYHRNGERTSLAEQRVKSIELARGDFIAVFDCDDIMLPEKIEQQLNYFEKNPDVDLLGCQIAIIDPRHDYVGCRRFPTAHEEIERELARCVPICHPAVMFRRSAYEKSGGYRDFGYDTAEDYDLWTRMVQSGHRVANHPDVLLYYRIHDQQMKSTRLRDTIRAVLAVKRTYWKGRMSLKARLQQLCERLMLFVPQGIATRLVHGMLYRDPPPASFDPASVAQISTGFANHGPHFLLRDRSAQVGDDDASIGAKPAQPDRHAAGNRVLHVADAFPSRSTSPLEAHPQGSRDRTGATERE